MHHFSPFELVPADTLDPGSIVLVTRREVVASPALIVRLQSQRRGVLLLQPPAGINSGKPSVLYSDVFGSGPVLKVPHAQAVLAVSSQAAAFRPAVDDVPPGALSIRDDGRYVVTGLGEANTPMTYALDDGEELEASYRKVWFPTWDIAVPDVNGKLQTLCTVKAST